jgi:gliding motility-associated lipoprotein GldD
MSNKNFFWLFVLVYVSSCGGDYLPRPLRYNRIDLPKRSFETLIGSYPYLLEVPVAATVEQDSFNIDQEAWINLNYRDMGAKVHLTYLPLGAKGGDMKMVLNDAINLTAKHQVKAYGIEESILLTPKGYTAVVAELSGEVPTQFQFFITDSTNHFLRGALYFNTAMKNDSLAPVIEHIKIDMTHLINTLQFKK